MVRFLFALSFSAIAIAGPVPPELPLTGVKPQLTHFEKFRSKSLGDVTAAMSSEGIVVVPVKGKVDPLAFHLPLTDSQLASLKSPGVEKEHIDFYAAAYAQSAVARIRVLFPGTLLPGNIQSDDRPFLKTHTVLIVSQFLTKADLLATYAMLLVETGRDGKGVVEIEDGKKIAYLDNLLAQQRAANLKLLDFGKEVSNLKEEKSPEFEPKLAEFVKQKVDFCELTAEFIRQGRGGQVEALYLALMAADQKELLTHREYDQLLNIYESYIAAASKDLAQLEKMIALVKKETTTPGLSKRLDDIQENSAGILAKITEHQDLAKQKVMKQAEAAKLKK